MNDCHAATGIGIGHLDRGGQLRGERGDDPGAKARLATVVSALDSDPVVLDGQDPSISCRTEPDGNRPFASPG